MWSTFFFNTGQAISTVYGMWQRLIKCLPLLKVKVKSLSHVQLFATPWTVDCQASLSMENLQARILEWVAMLFSRGSSQHGDWIQVSHIAGGFFTVLAIREAWKPEINNTRPKSGSQLGHTPLKAVEENLPLAYSSFWWLTEVVGLWHITPILKASIFKPLSAPFSHFFLLSV